MGLGFQGNRFEPVRGEPNCHPVPLTWQRAGIGLPWPSTWVVGIMVTPEELSKYKDVVGHILYPVTREGAVVYDSAA